MKQNVKDIRPRKKGLAHGYWKCYKMDTNKLWYEGNYINDKQNGVVLNYDYNGKLELKRYFI